MILMLRKMLVLVAIVLTACSAKEEGIRTSWSSLRIEQLNLKLIDQKQYESLSFSKEGWVAATFGSKDGPVTAPLFYWRVEGDRLVIFSRPDDKIYATLYEPRVAGNTLFVKSGRFESHMYEMSRAAGY